MKRLLALVLFLCLLCSCALAETPDVDEQLAKLCKNHRTTGAAIYVAKDGEIVYEFHYGYANKKIDQKVTEDTYFRTASVTKLISAIRVMQLVEDGTLDLDKSIGDYLGYKVQNLYHRKTPVTLRHLMTHTSSLDPHSGYSHEDRTLSQLIDAAGKHKANWYNETPGTQYRYSNFGAGIMGSLMEAVTGKNVNDAVTEGVFAPLGIDAAYHPTLVSETEYVASQYDDQGNIVRSRDYVLRQPWDASCNPDAHYRLTVGSVWIRPRDLCRLGMMLCADGTLDGVTILQPETVAAMEADQKGKGYVACNTPYGLCINRVDNLLKGKMIYGHQGMSEGVLCNLYYDPETQFVFALVTNGSSTNMLDHIGKLSRKTFKVAWDNFNQE